MPNVTEKAPLRTRTPRRLRPLFTRAPGSAWTVLAAVVGLTVLAPGGGFAQEPEAAAPAAAASHELRERIEELYEVVPIQGGLLLRPLEEYRGVRSLEITDATLAVNGEDVSREEARGWLGGRAEPVLRLLDLPAAERLALFGLGALPVAAPAAEPPAEPEEPEEPEELVEVEELARREEPRRTRDYRVRRGGQTVVGSHVHVAEDEVVGDVTLFAGSATIDGKVDGSVVVLGGSLRIEGEVRRDATVVGGSIHLGPEAEVGGDATAVGGSVHREPGARVRGRIEEARAGWGGPWWLGDRDWEWRIGWSPWWGLTEVIVFLTALILFGLLLAVVIALGRERAERAGARAAAEPVKAGVVGFLVTILFMPVFVLVMVLLCLTIIGIPIAVALALAFPFLMILWMVLALLGYTAVCLVVGRWIAHRFDRTVDSPYAASFLGLLVLALLLLVAKVLDIFGGPVGVFSAMFALAGILLQFVAWNVGLGAVCLDLYTRRAQRRAARLPAPPPAVPLPEPPPSEPAPGS
jgi:cytoskeletal protein CcmA (bactofilin family)